VEPNTTSTESLTHKANEILMTILKIFPFNESVSIVNKTYNASIFDDIIIKYNNLTTSTDEKSVNDNDNSTIKYYEHVVLIYLYGVDYKQKIESL
jgi:hypothetical protein